MNCPLCLSALSRTQYEGRPVFKCQDCSGYLVAAGEVTKIKRRREKSPEDLAAESSTSGLTSRSKIRCPRCHQPMDKEEAKGRYHIHIDKCRNCEMVWFDMGELARLQENYESSPRGQEAIRFQDRHKNMTEVERESFEEDLANLPPGDTSLLSAFGEGLKESFIDFFRRRTNSDLF